MQMIIDKKVLADIIGYLSTRPYREVVILIDKIQKNITPYREEKEGSEIYLVRLHRVVPAGRYRCLDGCRHPCRSRGHCRFVFLSREVGVRIAARQDYPVLFVLHAVSVDILAVGKRCILCGRVRWPDRVTSLCFLSQVFCILVRMNETQ